MPHDRVKAEDLSDIYKALGSMNDRLKHLEEMQGVIERNNATFAEALNDFGRQLRVIREGNGNLPPKSSHKQSTSCTVNAIRDKLHSPWYTYGYRSCPRRRVDTVAHPVYNGIWPKVRLEILERDHWLCQIKGPTCKVKARDVDHIVDWNLGGSKYDPANLRSVCKPCHNRRKVRHITVLPSPSQDPPRHSW